MKQQDMTDTEAKLKAWLKTKLPQAEDLSITSLEKTSSGFSNETYLFDLRWKQDGKDKLEKLVIRRPPPEGLPLFPDYDMFMQYRIMQCLDGTGIPVPKMYWIEEDTKVLGAPFYIMGRIDGEITPDTPPGPHGHGLLYDATVKERSELSRRLIEVIAKIHSLDWKSLGLSFLGAPKGGTDPLDRQIAYWEKMLLWAESEPIPLLHAAFDWVKKNRFEPSRVCLCWGDVHPGNVAYLDGKIVGVFDWELAHLGPPEADLAWFSIVDEVQAVMFGVPRLEGLLTIKETIQYYESLTGKPVENFSYHELFGALRLAVTIVQFHKNAIAAGLEGFPPDFGSNNAAAHKLEQLLGTTR